MSCQVGATAVRRISAARANSSPSVSQRPRLSLTSTLSSCGESRRRNSGSPLITASIAASPMTTAAAISMPAARRSIQNFDSNMMIQSIRVFYLTQRASQKDFWEIGNILVHKRDVSVGWRLPGRMFFSRKPRTDEFEAAAMPHMKDIYRTATRLLGNGTGADDVVQEVYLQAWKSFGQFE